MPKPDKKQSVQQGEEGRLREALEAVRRNISFLRSEASAGRELANQSLDADEQRKYRVRSESYEWAADNFDAALQDSEERCETCKGHGRLSINGGLNWKPCPNCSRDTGTGAGA